MRGRPTIVAALAAIGCSSIAAARADTSEPIRAVLQTSICSAEAEGFLDQILARTSKARRANDGEAARLFTITLTRRGDGVHGALAIEEIKGARSSREVDGDTCSEVVSALGLIGALAIDPQASTAKAVTIPPKAPLKPPSCPCPPDPRPHVSAPPIEPPKIPPPTPPPPPETPHVGVAAKLWALGGFAPGATPAMSASITLRLPDAFGILASSFAIGMVRADTGLRDVGAGSAEWQLLAARAELCPLRFVPIEAFPALEIVPCTAFEGGVLHARGVGRLSSAARDRPWGSFGIYPRLAIRALSMVRVEVEGGPVFPFVRDTFSFAPRSTVHETPVAGGFVGGGLSVTFP